MGPPRHASPPAALRLVLLSALAAITFQPTGARALEPRTLVHDGLERRYFVDLPSPWPPPAAARGKAPLVLVLHGGGGNAEGARRMTDFSRVALRDGAIVVYPEGSGPFERRFKTWNAGHCCGYAMRNHVDDVGFIAALIDRLEREEAVDPRRVYVTGMSNGAMMVHRLGIALSDRISAIAPVVGGLFGDEPPPAAPLPALIVNGALDRSVPLGGGRPGGRFADAWDGVPLMPAAYQGAFWAAVNGCGTKPRLEPTHGGTVSARRYPCPAGREVVQLIVADGGHAWPGGRKGSWLGDEPSQALDASAAIWAFFKSHAR